MDKVAREYSRALLELSKAVTVSLESLDRVMAKPNSTARDKNLSKVANFLDLANDIAMHNGLGWGFRKIENTKKKIRETL